MRKAPYQVVIVGGGISGLATAHAVMEEAQKNLTEVQCTVVEQDTRWGGKILTHVTEDLLIEGGPDSFLTSKPWAIELCRHLGLHDQLIPTNANTIALSPFAAAACMNCLRACCPFGLNGSIPWSLAGF